MDTVLAGLGARAEMPLPEPSHEQSLILSIVVDDAGMTLVDTGFLISPAPNNRKESLAYEVHMLAVDGSLLGVFPFSDPRELLGEPGPEPKPSITSAPATIILPYFYNIDRAEVIQTATGDVLLDVDFSNFDSGLVGPVADAGGPYSGNEGDTILLDASGSFQTGGSIVRYEWDLNGDGSVDVDTSAPTASYTPGDNFTGLAYVRVSNADGLTAVASADVSIANVAPTIEVGCDVFGFNDGVPFTVEISDPGSLDTYTIHWSFGDGTTLDTTSASIVHTYPRPGFYPVTVTVSDDDGATATDQVTAEVKNTPSDPGHRRQVRSHNCTLIDGHGQGNP
jgi:hypothetical protein